MPRVDPGFRGEGKKPLEGGKKRFGVGPGKVVAADASPEEEVPGEDLGAFGVVEGHVAGAVAGKVEDLEAEKPHALLQGPHGEGGLGMARPQARAARSAPSYRGRSRGWR